jgi:hypothetical protein
VDLGEKTCNEKRGVHDQAISGGGAMLAILQKSINGPPLVPHQNKPGRMKLLCASRFALRKWPPACPAVRKGPFHDSTTKLGYNEKRWDDNCVCGQG